MTKHPVRYCNKITLRTLKFNHYPDIENFPNAGPNPNVTGMRRFWGEDAYLVRRGQYVYNVSSYPAIYYACPAR